MSSHSSAIDQIKERETLQSCPLSLINFFITIQVLSHNGLLILFLDFVFFS